MRLDKKMKNEFEKVKKEYDNLKRKEGGAKKTTYAEFARIVITKGLSHLKKTTTRKVK